MKYYIPKLQLGLFSTSQTSIEDKFDGLPWGIPSASWPVCRSCDKTMSLIAQLNHHAERLNLGRSGRSLFIFMCCNPYSQCEWTWDSAEGCNSSFVLEPESLETGITYPPDVAQPDSAEIRFWGNCTYNQERDPGATIWIETEVRVLGWLEQDGSIPESARSDFMSESRYGSLDREYIKSVYNGTKLGSVPSWVQWPQNSDWDFIGQFSDYYGFHTPLPNRDMIESGVWIG